MTKTSSTMLALGTQAKDFQLQDTISGKMMTLTQLKSDIATVIMFICNHCPFVAHIELQLVKLANDYQAQGIAFIAISANDANAFPQDSPAAMKEKAIKLAYPFPYLYDKTQEVAKAYQAACTPDFYIFDSKLQCVYRGQLDDSRPDNQIAVTGKDIRAALDALLSKQAVNPNQRPSIGCNIKWRQE